MNSLISSGLISLDREDMNGIYLKCFSQRDCYSQWNPLVVRVQHSVFDSAQADVEKKKLVHF